MEQQETALNNNLPALNIINPQKKPIRRQPLTSISLSESTKLRLIALRIHPKFKNIRGTWDIFFDALVDYFKKKYNLTLKIHGEEVQ